VSGSTRRPTAITLTHDGRTLPYRVFEQQPHVVAGAVVENKRLGAALEVIQVAQDKRDEERLASKKLTLRQKQLIREARAAADRPRQPLLSVAPPRPSPAVVMAKYGIRGTKRDGFYLYEKRYSPALLPGSSCALWASSTRRWHPPGPGEATPRSLRD
jgi:hypothetical protein